MRHEARSEKNKGQKIPRKAIDHEIELLHAIQHPNIVQLFESVENSDFVYLLLELVKGSDLYDVQQTLGTLRPGLAGAIIGKIVSAVSYLHSRGIAHHDIKPENVIVDFLQNKVKLTDFGSAVEFKNMSGIGGTLNYMSPELLLNLRGNNLPIDQSIDIWSIGIVAYQLLSGQHPFNLPTKANNNIMNNVISGKYSFPSPQWDAIPKHCKDFIQRCLQVDPKRRATASDLLKHPWITASSSPIPVNSFTKKDQERLEHARSCNNSRSNSNQSLMELFGNNIPTRSWNEDKWGVYRSPVHFYN